MAVNRFGSILRVRILPVRVALNVRLLLIDSMLVGFKGEAEACDIKRW